MILLDSNLHIYARIPSLPQHERTRLWLDQKLNGEAPVGIPWPSIVGFMRIMTNRRVFEKPLSTSEAWKCIVEWLDLSRTWIPLPTARHQEILTSLLASDAIAGDLLPDAHLAAIAIGHDLTLCSADTHFALFPGLRWENPLAR